MRDRKKNTNYYCVIRLSSANLHSLTRVSVSLVQIKVAAGAQQRGLWFAEIVGLGKPMLDQSIRPNERTRVSVSLWWAGSGGCVCASVKTMGFGPLRSNRYRHLLRVRRRRRPAPIL